MLEHYFVSRIVPKIDYHELNVTVTLLLILAYQRLNIAGKEE